jgi:hemolysin activation/secretion protein
VGASLWGRERLTPNVCMILSLPNIGPAGLINSGFICRQADSAGIFVFFDHGSASCITTQPGLTDHASFESAGIGLNYSISRYLDARFDYGWQFDKAPGATSRSGLANISVTLAY